MQAILKYELMHSATVFHKNHKLGQTTPCEWKTRLFLANFLTESITLQGNATLFIDGFKTAEKNSEALRAATWTLCYVNGLDTVRYSIIIGGTRIKFHTYRIRIAMALKITMEIRLHAFVGMLSV